MSTKLNDPILSEPEMKNRRWTIGSTTTSSMKKYKDFFEDVLKGGKGDLTDIRSIDRTQLKLGIKIEKEHTLDNKLAAEIAIDHLTEDPEYYSKLNHAGLADELGATNPIKDVSLEIDIKDPVIEKIVSKFNKKYNV